MKRCWWHRWRDVQPEGRTGRTPYGVYYQACARTGCDARRVLDLCRGGAYRGGADLEGEWVRTGRWPDMPPPRPPAGGGGVGRGGYDAKGRGPAYRRGFADGRLAERARAER